MELINKRILVTGGTGFLGSYVVEALSRRGCNDISAPRSSEFDLRERADIRRLFESFRPEVVFHLAAVVGGIEANRLYPGRFFYDNAIMGIELMEQARLFGIEKFIGVGTICSYPKFTPVPFHEEDLWNGYPEETNAAYGLAKKMMLVQGQAYRDQYGFKSIFLMPVNLYGPRDNFDLTTSHVIPALIRKFDEAVHNGHDEVQLWGDGSPSREFLYVGDAAEALVLAAERYDGPEPVNVGKGEEVTIKELADIVAEATGFTGKFVWDTSKPNGQPRRCLDVSRAREYFGFEASTSLRDGIRMTVDWYRQNAGRTRHVTYT
jgi:GDP-L-fucose synthase